ncbi:MAG: translation initiation factor eIF-2B [Clostridiales bacterium]|nr:translation initiation factor eIF-2B [Clostridiales bacterium]
MPQYVNDIFIAYHGTYAQNGSYAEAKKIATFLRSKGYSVYIFEEKDGSSWAETPKSIIESRTMLVVLNQSVLLDNNGLISKERTVAGAPEPYQLYVEMSTFKTQVNAGLKSPQTLNFVYCGQDKDSAEARAFCAHQVYGMDALNNILASDYQSSDGKYIPIVKWLDTAIQIQNKWDLDHAAKKAESAEVDAKKLKEIFIEIENEMFAQNCVAVLGPTLNELCLNFSEGVGSTFFERCESLLNRGRNHLEDALNKTFFEDSIPRYIQHFSKFPFAAFLTTDEYSRIDKAIQLAGKESALIREEQDIYSLNLQDGQIPVFELKRSNVWTDDCNIDNAIIASLLKMLLTGRRILYIGYNDKYDGYKRVGATLRKLLGDDFFTCTNNIAIVDNSEYPAFFYDKENRFTVINISTEAFANKMETSNELFKKLLNMNDGDNKFVVDLFKIAATPTETQAIKLLLEQLYFDVRSRMSLEKIIEKYDKNVSCLKAIKPNFNAFEKCWLKIKAELAEGEIDSIEDLELIVQQVKMERSQISKGIRKQGKNNLTDCKGSNILLYSQSLRVVEYLNGASEEFKKNSNLWICECRPKSDEPFRDAKNTCQLLKESNSSYNITIIPDMAAFNMMSRGLIDLVVLGAHDIVLYQENPISFINTCGTAGLLNYAKEKGIPVCVVAETGKFTEAIKEGDSLKYEISYGHEITIYNNFKFALWAKNENINTQNIGYDFCRFYDGVVLVSEKSSIQCKNIDVDIVLVDKTKGG